MIPGKRASFLKHLHPPMIRERTVRPLATLGLGVVCLACLVVLALTGITLLLYYIPHRDVAYDRILHIMTTLRYGKLIRNLHYLAANVLLLAAILHLARVFLTGSYQGRFLNWVYGLLLLSLVFVSNYTGYLLPWDQTAYWAIRVGSSLTAYLPVIGPSVRSFLLGGGDIGEDTLIRSFALHVAGLPLLYVVLVSLHLWRIRKDGGLAAPAGTENERITAAPTLFRAELAVGLLTLSLLLGLSFLIGAPLAERADPLHPPNPAKAPWYFVGIQEMVSHSATIGGVVLPMVIGLFLLVCPLIDRSRGTGGRWLAKGRLTLNVMFVFVFLSQLAFIVVGQWFRVKNWVFLFPW